MTQSRIIFCTMLDVQLLKLYCMRARMEAPNIILNASRAVGTEPPAFQLGCAARCNGLVAASLLPGSRITPLEASTIASSITCMERAFALHNGGRKNVLIGDALLGRVFRHMARVDFEQMEFLAYSEEYLALHVTSLREDESLSPDGVSSRKLWTTAVGYCGLQNTDAYSVAIADQRTPNLAEVCALPGMVPETRDTMMTLITSC